MNENRGRTAVILLAVALSSGLLFASLGMATTVEAMYTRVLRTNFGDAHLMVHADRTSPGAYPPERPLRDLAHRLAYAVPAVQGSGELVFGSTGIGAYVRGLSLDDLDRVNPVPIVGLTSEHGSFAGRQMIVSAATADELDLTVGDLVHLEFGGVSGRYRIVGIAEPLGFFADSGSAHPVLLPFDTATGLLGARGRAPVWFLQAREASDRFALQDELSERMPGYVVRQTVTDEQRSEYARTVTIPFRIMLFLVVAVALFIIYSSFQVVVTERLPVIGTFRSLGATRRTTTTVLLCESAAYGALGGLLGVGIGIGMLHLMAYIGATGWVARAGRVVRFTTLQAAASFGFALLLCVGSSLIPILRTARYPVKDVILRLYQHPPRSGPGRTAVGTICFALGIILPLGAPEGWVLVLFGVGMGLVLVGMIMVVPAVTGLMVSGFQVIYSVAIGTIGRLAAKNLRENQGILNNVVLLTIGICGMFLINTISTSMADSVANVYRDARYDLEVWSWPADRVLESRLRRMPQVDEVYGYYQTGRVPLPERREEIRRVIGVDPAYATMWSPRYSAPGDELLARLGEKRSIIASYALRDRLGLEIGDRVTLEMRRRTNAYEVIGFVDSRLHGGDFALAGSRFVRTDDGRDNVNSFLVRAAGDAATAADAAAEAIREQFALRGVRVQTLAEQIARRQTSDRELFFLLQAFSWIAMLIGTVGVVNNFIVGFLARRHTLALLRSVGMSRRQMVGMVVTEAITVGVIGAVTGMATSGALLHTIPAVLASFRIPLIVIFSWPIAAGMLLVGVAVTTGASVSPAIRSYRLQIVEALRYE